MLEQLAHRSLPLSFILFDDTSQEYVSFFHQEAGHKTVILILLTPIHGTLTNGLMGACHIVAIFYVEPYAYQHKNVCATKHLKNTYESPRLIKYNFKSCNILACSMIYSLQ